MRVSCPKCKAVYAIPDEKIGGKAVKFRCRHCQNEIILRATAPGQGAVSRPPAPPQAPRLPPPPPPLPRDERRDERQRAAERDREAALQRRRESERKASEQAAAERRAAEEEAAARRAAEDERRLALAEQEAGAAADGREITDVRTISPDMLARKEPGKVRVQAQSVDEGDAERKELVERAIKRRAKARVGRHEERIAEEFFTTGASGIDEGVLPPPGCDPAGEAAVRLPPEAIHEEYAILEGTDAAAQEQRRARDAEAARVAAMQAGVKSQKKRLALALLAVGGVVVALGGFLGLGLAQGWFTAFTGLTARGPDGELLDLGAVASGELTSEEARRIREHLLAERQPGRKPGGSRAAGPGRPALDPGADALGDVLGKEKPALTASEAALAAFYQGQDGARPASPTLRGVSEAELSAMGIHLLGGVGLPGDPLAPAAAKPEVIPAAPGAAGGPRRLTEQQIRLTLERNRPQVKACLERQLKKDSSVSGKLELLVRVLPDGRVESVRVATEKFRDSYLEECLLKRVKEWTFPSFEGEAYELTLPLLLTAQDGA